MKEYKEKIYHIEVDHESGTFRSDMDFLTQNPKDAYEQLQVLKEKYPGHEIKIEKITQTKSYLPLSQSQLEKIIKLEEKTK